MIIAIPNLRITQSHEGIRISEQDSGLGEPVMRVLSSLPWIMVGLLCIVGAQGMRPTPGKEIAAAIVRLFFIAFMGLLPLTIGLQGLLLRESFLVSASSNQLRHEWRVFGMISIWSRARALTDIDTIRLHDESLKGKFSSRRGFCVAMSMAHVEVKLAFFEDQSDAEKLAELLSVASGLPLRNDLAATAATG